MWPITGVPANPMVPLFEATKATAANLPQAGDKGTYTAELFQQDFPEFFTKTKTDGVATYTPMIPAATIDRYVEAANSAITPGVWGSDWRDAVGLYTAHLTALRLQTYADGSTPAAAAASAANAGTVKSASMGDTSVSYDNTAINAATERWGTWNATRYGAQLATMARMIGLAGMYVI